MFGWGDESIYCSELIYKGYAKTVNFQSLAPKKMLFDINPEYWDKYFRGNTPRGELGISPADFDITSDFIDLFEI